ncbi:hypothetical protein PsAD2_03975 [Pseudovibrio axinellae]|uniref:PLL-like beta propeller domain-containing protein n=1 Tax=Pseudovibrio axinellae TaxID=989403 RepID=A0A161XD42_9HYPH|nr:hypothetical protein [Pseudovibrio axinellae]KZL12668.1 hypothetical protein PsAD2_03975 [Pseudovibrio axinellae]SEP62245.1 hypothetical protein SAMN05421798_1015 [Pseudovibrio axinellae]
MSIEEIIPEFFSPPEEQPSAYFRIFIAAINRDGNLAYTEQMAQDGKFSKEFKPLTNLAYDHETLSAFTTANGDVALLAKQADKDSLVYVSEKRNGTSTDRFFAPYDLGMPPDATALRYTEVIHGLNGKVNIFAGNTSDDGQLWWKYQNPNVIKEEIQYVTPPGSNEPIEVHAQVEAQPDVPWSAWHPISAYMEMLSSANNADGRIILAGLDSEGIPYLNFQSSQDPFAEESWLGWQDISGGNLSLSDIKIANDTDGRVYLFGVAGKSVYLKHQMQLGQDQFTPWMHFSRFDKSVSQLLLGMTADGGIYFLAKTGDQKRSLLYGCHQIPGELNLWTQPAVIETCGGDSILAMHPNANSKLSLFAFSPRDQQLSYSTQASPGFWEVFSSIGGPVTNFAVTADITPNSE